jgi:hypothetical protein
MTVTLSAAGSGIHSFWKTFEWHHADICLFMISKIKELRGHAGR